MTNAVQEQRPRSPASRFEQKREEILDRAVEVFNRLGVRGAALADVAQESGLTLTAIRHYFPKREHLVATLLEGSIAVLTRIANEAAKEATPDQRVRALIRGHFQFRRRVRLKQERDTLHFGDVRAMDPEHADRIWPLYNEMFRACRRVIATKAERDANRQRANVLTQILVAQFVRSTFWLPEYDVEDFGRVEARFTEIILNGLASAPQKWTSPTADLPEEDLPEKRSMESFLSAAAKVINASGYRGASVERIAAQLNVSKGSFYHHATTKDAIVAACCDRTFQLMTDAQRLAVTRETRGMDQALVATSILVRLQQTNRGPLLRNSALTSMKGEAREQMSHRMTHVAGRFADMINDGMLDGTVRPCDARIAGHMLMAMVNSAEEAPRWVQDFTAETCVDLYVRPMFVGLSN